MTDLLKGIGYVLVAIIVVVLGVAFGWIFAIIGAVIGAIVLFWLLISFVAYSIYDLSKSMKDDK